MSVYFLFQESRYYYKIVPCSKVSEIEEELNKLLSGKLKNCLVVSLLRATPSSPSPHPPTSTLGGEGGLRFAPCKGIRIPESGKFLLLKLRESWNTAQGFRIPLKIGIWNPSSTDKRNLVPGIRNPRRGVQNPRR